MKRQVISMTSDIVVLILVAFDTPGSVVLKTVTLEDVPSSLKPRTLSVNALPRRTEKTDNTIHTPQTTTARV
eukprot:CAMPEP_0117604026 /NCGR_PEP_ID=MMETSP0784-20121206/78469_1 /TAXON_ID=39447 /ORGANISM="" /LENGTH=71 /DNA_ID=CAMNT_0005407033 /DNA_START=1017 /DNA_END=1228 /DNA_ORIENTATION=+